METTCRAAIVDKNKILLIHRFRKGEEYFVLPGGHVEPGESEEETLIRELKEETNLDIKIDKKLWSLISPYNNSLHHFFLVTKFSGKLKLGGPELEKNSKENKFLLEWHDMKDIPKLNMVPAPLKKKMIEEFL